MRLVDADALMPRLEFIREAEHQIFYGKESWGFVSKCITAVEDAPTIEERKTGKWIKLNSYDRRDNFYACSECGRLINIICNAHLEDYPFCHCGAKMDGSE